MTALSLRGAIAAHGVSVWLKADIDVLMERVSKKQNRPLLKNPDPRGVMLKLMEQRYPVYTLADVTVETRDERKEVIADEVIAALAGHLRHQHLGAWRTRGEGLYQCAQVGRIDQRLLPTGHWVHVEDPDGMARAIVEAL